MPHNGSAAAKHRNVPPYARIGAMSQLLVATLVVIALMGAAIWWSVTGTGENPADAPLLTSVTRGPYEHIVLEQGEVESSNNVEVRCEVKNRAGGNSPATTILEVIPEGTNVKKGDWLITFDSSALESELTQQTILCKTSETLVIKAKAVYETSVMAQKEYLEGTYEQERKTIENEIFVAEEALKKAELSFDSIKRSVSRGLISPLQLEGERYRVDAARKDLELAKKKIEVLDKYTKEKMMTQLNSDIDAAKIQWENEQASHNEELKKLQEIKDQIAVCTVTAPQDGQVVYANVQSRRSESEYVVEGGASVRERQELIRLPDPRAMQVSAKINESQINLVRKGMQATIRIDALGEQKFQGMVTKVNKYAEAEGWGSNAKEYKTEIQILDPPAHIRSGLTAEVRIHIESCDDALQMPVQAIMEHKGRTFCLVKRDGEYATRAVAIASTNDKVVSIDEAAENGPLENEEIVLNPRAHIDLFDFSGFDFDDAVSEPPNPANLADNQSNGPVGQGPADAIGRVQPQQDAPRARPDKNQADVAGDGTAGDSSQSDTPRVEPKTDSPSAQTSATPETDESTPSRS